MRRFLPVLTLVLIAPIIAELLWGSTPISRIASLLVLLPLYGGGALFIRELVRRSGRGWASVLLLGAAFGIVEEGLALQSFFNPLPFGASPWSDRVLGINGLYSIWATGYHMVWSVALPILLTEMLFPAQRTTPYLGRVGLVVTGLFYALGVALLGFITVNFVSHGYWAPPVLLGLTVLVVMALGGVALGGLSPGTPRQRREISAPSPWLVLLVAGIAGYAWQALLIKLEHAVPALAHGTFMLIPLGSALLVAALAGWLISRWVQSRDWNDLHNLSLAAGALIAHTLFGVLYLTPTLVDRVGLIVLGLLMNALLVLFAVRLRGRVRKVTDASKRHDSEVTAGSL
ncbi:MAG: hypothetical protein IMW89_03530 [Ktedonobacteraceae bacterium]|nr:hypothetical protein [Ktedonobacteraceae bacterium]